MRACDSSFGLVELLAPSRFLFSIVSSHPDEPADRDQRCRGRDDSGQVEGSTSDSCAASGQGSTTQ
jgi:hypothetical protein